MFAKSKTLGETLLGEKRANAISTMTSEQILEGLRKTLK